MDKYETSSFTPSGEYKQNIGLGTGYVDIPVGFKDLSKFSGTMGHKLNHLFNNTCQIRNVRHFLTCINYIEVLFYVLYTYVQILKKCF